MPQSLQPAAGSSCCWLCMQCILRAAWDVICVQALSRLELVANEDVTEFLLAGLPPFPHLRTLELTGDSHGLEDWCEDNQGDRASIGPYCLDISAIPDSPLPAPDLDLGEFPTMPALEELRLRFWGQAAFRGESALPPNLRRLHVQGGSHEYGSFLDLDLAHPRLESLLAVDVAGVELGTCGLYEKRTGRPTGYPRLHLPQLTRLEILGIGRPGPTLDLDGLPALEVLRLRYDWGSIETSGSQRTWHDLACLRELSLVCECARSLEGMAPVLEQAPPSVQSVTVSAGYFLTPGSDALASLIQILAGLRPEVEKELVLSCRAHELKEGVVAQLASVPGLKKLRLRWRSAEEASVEVRCCCSRRFIWAGAACPIESSKDCLGWARGGLCMLHIRAPLTVAPLRMQLLRSQLPAECEVVEGYT